MYPYFNFVCVMDDKISRILVQITTYSNMSYRILIQILFFKNFSTIYKMPELLKKLFESFYTLIWPKTNSFAFF